VILHAAAVGSEARPGARSLVAGRKEVEKIVEVIERTVHWFAS
jgi:hypothetical protein